ncbi:MAG: M56 family metallopeptidase [Planctomycetota bacterium]|jgi:beta-lactamase regulating signal transducer with metallopeptidase domain
MIQFIENLNALGRWLVENFGRISIEVAILAAIVAVAIVILRIKRPAVRHVFWCLVLIKPAVALFFASPISLYWYLLPEPQPAPTPIVQPAPPIVRPLMRPASPVMPIPSRPPTIARRPIVPPSPPPPTAWETFDNYGIGCVIWLAGVGVLLVRLIVGFAYVSFLRQTSRRQKVGLLAEAVADLRRELKLRRSVRVAVSYVAHGPVLGGIIRPTILIPNDLAEDLTVEQARLIVGHELAHVKRWDNLVLLFQRIIEVFFFFHPVIWLTGWLMRREAEAAADDAIISAGGRPADYADALARAAEIRIGLTRRMLVNTFAASESDHARRVRRILNGRVAKTSFAMGILAVVALITIAIIGLPGPAERKPDKDTDMTSGLKTSEQLAAAVKRDGDTVWIEGVPNEQVGGGWLGIPRGVALLLKHRGEEVEFEDVLAYSGDAFHLSIATQWQFMGYMAIPTDPVANILAAYGYDGGYHHTEPMPKGADAIRAATDGLLAEYYAKIDVGRPVLVGGVSDEGCGAWSVVAGYNTDALQLYHVGLADQPRWSNIRGINAPLNDETFESGCWNSQVRGSVWPGMIGHWMDNCGVYLGDKVAEPAPREVALKTLALAVQLHKAPTHNYDWNTYFGARAYEAWARELHELDYPADAVKAASGPLWDVYSLSQISRLPEAITVGRSAAASFCEKSAKDLPEAKDHLLAAAQAYREEASIAKEAFAVLLEGTDKQQEAWLSDEANREAGVTAIAQMLEKDQLAIRHIQAALVAASAPAAAVAARPIEYGFRVDPMTWVENAEGLDAALVRREVFDRATEADDALIAAEIERLLAEAAADKNREDLGPLVNALRLGCDPNRPEVKTAAGKYIRKDLDNSGVLRGGSLALAVMTGWSEGDEPLKSMRAFADAPVPPPGRWDPWTHCGALDTLHSGRELIDVRESVGRWMKVIDDGMDELACWHKMDVWDLLSSISRIDDPRASGIIKRYIPVLLRTQGPDGGWGGKSPQVFRALARHGLLDDLRTEPPLPAEWRVVRTIPAPKGTLKTLVSDGERFWVLDTEAKQAIAISPKDGRELKRMDLDLKTTRGLGWYDGLLVVTAGGFLEADDPARVVLIDADRDQVVKVLPFTRDIWYPAGAVQIGRLLWTSQDAWITTIDIATGECRGGRPYGGAWPLDLAYDGQAIWSTDTLVPGLFRWGTDGRLLDFAEMPFFESFQTFGGDAGMPVAGITYTDEGLWVLSESTNQIALIERIGPTFVVAPADRDAAAPATGATAMQAVPQTTAFDIPKLADMDASASPAQWGDRGFRVDILEPYGPRKPVSEFGARFRLGWDDAGLWLHATVTDDEFRSAESIEALWQNQADLILLYVIRDKGEFARILIEPGMTADQPQPRILTSAEGNGLGVRVTREKTDGGYVLQAWVPWDQVGMTPSGGAGLRAQVAFLDADNDGEDVIVGGAVWYPGVGTAENTDISYALRLADQPSPPRTAIVWPGEDKITVTAPAEHIGKTIRIVEDNRTLAEKALAADQDTGYATATIPLPLPPLTHPLAQPVVTLGDQSIGSLSAIVLWGKGQQSFSVCAQAAARAFGRDPDLETILCLSSNAFAPSLRVKEDCTSWWMNQGSLGMRCIDTVAKAIGLSARDMDLPKFTGDYKNLADRKEYGQRAAVIIREAMADGEIIVSPGGWSSERGFAPWCWAGIITEAREDGTVLGACLTGRPDNVLEDVYGLWAISPAEPTLSAHEADLIALQQGVDRIRGAGRFTADEGARFGLDAMDTYIEHMRTVPGFCAGCFERAPDRAWGDARDSATAVHDNAKVAASYLRRRIGTFTVEARPHIDAAAKNYDRIVELLDPFVSGDGPKHYQKWINGDLAAQKRHADDVLVPVRAELAAAADAMARVLAAEAVAVTPAPPAGRTAAAVRREGSKVWIDGVPAERRVEGMWHMDGLPASLRAALKFKGVEAKYLDDTLFGAITGQPFRFWFADDFASCLAYTHEEAVGVIVAEALGYDYTWCDHGAITLSGDVPERVTTAVDAWQKVREELDAGHPVVLFGGSTPPDETASPVLVTGYDTETGTVYFVPHADWGPAPEWKDEDPQCRDGIKGQGYRGRPQPDQINWHGNGFAPNHGQGGAAVCFFAFGDRRRVLTEREVATAVLRRAVALGRGRLIDKKRDYRKSGLVAFDALIASLGRDEIHAFGGTRPWGELGDWWFAMDSLTQGGFRQAAAAFLRRCVAGFGGFSESEREHLLAAAEAYDESGRHMARFMELFARAAPRGDDEDKWLRAAGEALESRDFRAKAADIVRRIRAAEEDAIGEVEKALAAAPTPTGGTADDLTATVKREGSKVWIDGVPDGTFGTSWDMLARAMQTLLTYRGEKVDFDELLAYSGDAFNLCHGDNWQGVSYLCAPTDIVGNMAAAYGYEYEAIHNGYPYETMDGLERPARVELTERAVDRIQAEIDAGRPPLVGGVEGGCANWTLAVGYDRSNGDNPSLCHVGVHEPYRWISIRGLAAGWVDEDFGYWNGRFRGTIRDGFVGGWQVNPAYFVKAKKARTPTRRENVLAALARAVQLHQAPSAHVDWWGGIDYHFGRRAYEQWAAALHKLDFPADLDKPQPDDAYDWYSMGNMDVQADQIVRGRSAAAAFCEKAARDLPEAKDHLLAAAKAYREEAALAKKAFGVFLTGSDAQREAWLSDEGKREAGVTAIGQMLEKDELAVRHIQSALAATPVSAREPTGPTAADLATTVKREGSKVWIEGVPNMPVGKGREWDGLLKGLHLLMTHRGEDVTLEELMALSGDAFHVCFGTRWQERTTHMIPTDPLANAAGALGYGSRWTTQSRYHRQFGSMTSEQREASAREYLQEVHSQIDTGMPVLFGGVYGMCGDWRAAVGYDPAEDMICYVGDMKKPYDWTKVYDEKVLSDDFGYWDTQLRGTVRPGFTGGWIGNTAFLLGAKARDVSEAEQVATALSRAVQLHRASSHPRGGDTFYFGARAYEQWAKELHELDYPLRGAAAQRREDEPECYDFSTMLYLTDQIVRGRSAARAFCERAAEVFPKAEDDLLAAAWAYREETTIVVKMFGVFLTGTEAQREAWLSDEAKREAGVTAIGRMLEKEAQAIGHIEAALAVVGAAAPSTPVAGTGQPMQAIQSTPVFDIPKVEFDGLIVEGRPFDWGERGFRVDIMTPFGPRKPANEFGARFRLGWDDTGLMLLATVTDDQFHSAESVEKLWGNEADLILLYLIPKKDEVVRIVIEPGMTADQPSPRTITDGGGNSIGVRVTREKTDGGYVLQAWVPWTEVGIEPAEGTKLRAQVIVLDVDKAGENIQMGGALWYPAVGTQNDTNISHRLRLADQPSRPEVALVDTFGDRLTVTAAAEQVGKAVSVIEGGRTLATAALTKDDATGYAAASIPLPLPPLSSPIAQPTVMFEGQPIAALNPLQLRLDNYAFTGQSNDTLSLALVAAAKALGRDADFESVVCLSSNAFAPMLDAKETCTAWWIGQAWQADRCIQTVAGRLGLRIRKLDLPAAEGGWNDDNAMAAHRRKIAPILREAMDGGEVIITTGGWDRPEGSLMIWCWAGIITEARDDGTILGACINGRTDNPIYHAYTMYAVSAAEPTLSAHEADLVMLQQAINRIRGAERFESDDRSRYGLAAMDVWAEQMRKVPYCDPCQKSNPDRGPAGCAASSAGPLYVGAESAASYLRRRIGTFNVEARPHVEAAARHYDRIYLLLHPALTGQGGRNYSRIIANQQLQNAHADNVLVPVRAHLAAAANAMERALAAEGVLVAAAAGPSPAMDLPDYDKLALKGHHHAKDSFSLTMQAVARLYGIKADYETVYALSTNGFAPDIYPDEPCRSFWRMHGRGQCLDLVAAYLGLDIRPIDPATPETIRQALASGAVVIMDRGWEPDVYCWWGIVLEVDDDDSLPVIRRMRGATQNGRTDNPVDHIGRCWAITRGTPTLTQVQADALMLRRALSRIRGDAPPFVTGRLIFGLAAMDLWIAQMAKADFQEDDPLSSAGNARLCALYTYQGAKDTAAYLRERLDSFPAAAQSHVASIAARYERIAKLLESFTVWEERKGYQAFMGDVAKQKVHAEEVLRPVKAEMAAAADDIEGVLAAMNVSTPVMPADDPAAALTKEFTAKQLTQLAGWSSLYGDLEVVLREAAENPQLAELLRQRLALGSISAEAAAIRSRLGRLEPAEDTYLSHVENIVRAIAAGEWGNREQQFFMPGRAERLAELRGIMADWVDGVSKADALAKHDDDTTVERIYALLGEHTDAKAEAVAGLAGKFSEGGDCDEKFYEYEAMEDKTTVAEKMAHHITMLDKPLWHLEYSLSVTLAGIGNGESIGDWRTPGGHLGWKNWINPKDLPRVKTIATALEVWLAGGEAEGDVAEIVTALGEQDAYREKVWLAGCLLHCLRVEGERADEFVAQLKTDWLPLGPEGFTMDDLTDSLVTGDIGWYWPRPTE